MNKNSIDLPEEVWGAIQYITIPEQDIYFICGRQVDGYVIPQNYAGKIISKKALDFGVIRGEFLYFPSGETMNIIEYEVVCHQLRHAQNDAEHTFLQEKMASIEQFGRVDLPGYFGEYPPPNETPLGITEDFIRVDNGLYFTKSKGEWMLGICEPIADCELTIIGGAFGRKKKDYSFYDTVTCAIPICELRHTYPAVAALVSSEEALYQTLCSHFPTYILVYNDGEELQANRLPTEMPADTDTAFLAMPQR